MADNAPLVIIGTGLAGYNLAKEFRKLDSERPLLMISADDGRFYSKPLLSTGFAKGKEADELGMQDAATMAAQLNADVLTGARVTAIGPASRTLTVDGRSQPYSDLVLATGAEVRSLPWRDALGERLLSINDLTDYGQFRAALQGRRKVVIVGAGLIGCEFANDLRLGGFEVAVVATDPWPTGREPSCSGVAMWCCRCWRTRWSNRDGSRATSSLPATGPPRRCPGRCLPWPLTSVISYCRRPPSLAH